MTRLIVEKDVKSWLSWSEEENGGDVTEIGMTVDGMKGSLYTEKWLRGEKTLRGNRGEIVWLVKYVLYYYTMHR